MSEPNRPTREEVTDWADFTTGPLLERADGKRLCLGYLALLDECESLRKQVLSLAPLLEVKPQFQEVFIPNLNGGMAVCLACGAFDDMVMIRKHRADCPSKAQWDALQALREAIDAAMESK